MATQKLNIGKWVVDPATLSLINGEQEATLRLKAMLLLLKLAERPGEVFTRDELIFAVWPETNATDDTLNSTIAQLRKVLVNDAAVPKYIATIPKRGYRLLAPVEPVNATTSESNAHNIEQAVNRNVIDDVGKRGKLAPFTHVKIQVALAVLAVLIGVLWLVFGVDRHTNELPSQSHYHAKLLASETDAESYPQFSNSGDRVVFVRVDINTGFGQLVVKDIRTEQELVLNDQPMIIANPVWSPNGEDIAYMYFDGLSCRVNLVSSGGGPSRTVAECYAALAGTFRPSLDWLPSGNGLIIPQRAPGSESVVLSMLNLATSDITQVSFLKQSAQGDSNQRVSADGSKIAFTRTSSTGVDRVGVIELASGKEQLFDLPLSVIRGLAWTDHNKLIIASNLRGRSETWELTTETGELHWLGIGGYGIVHVDFNPINRALIASEVHVDNNINIFQVDGIQGDAQHLNEHINFKSLSVKRLKKIASSKSENLVSVSVDAQKITFIREFSAVSELWLDDISEENPKRLLRLDDTFVNSLSWSPQSKSLMLRLIKDAKSSVYIYEIDSGHFFPVEPQEDNIYSAIWSESDNIIYYNTFKQGRWKIWEYQLSDGKRTLITNEGGNRLQLDVDNKRILFSHYSYLGIKALNYPQKGKENQQGTTPYKLNFAEDKLFRHWQFKNNTLYYTLLSEPIPKSIYRDGEDNIGSSIYFSSEHLIAHFDINHRIIATSETESRAADVYLYTKEN